MSGPGAPPDPAAVGYKLVDAQGNVSVPTDLEAARRQFLAGTHTIRAAGPVPGRDEQGRPVTVAPEHLQQFLQAGGQLATHEDIRQAELDAKYGGIGGTALAGVEGVGRGLSLGVLDPVAVGGARLFGGDKAAEAVRTHLAEEKEAHPWVSGAGEVAGAIAPVLLSAGAAAPEEIGVLGGARVAAGLEEASTLGRVAQGVRTLGVLPRGVNAAGDLAEHAASGLLGATADTVLGRAGQSAAKTAARSIVEAGLMGAGQAYSEATLENKPLTAEKLATSVGHSMFYGGLLGFGLGGAGKLVAEGGQALIGKLSPKLDELAGEQAFKWLAPKNAVTKEAIARAGGTEEVGRVVLDDVMRPLIEERGMGALRMDPEEKLDAIRAAVDKAGKAIGEKIAGYSEATVKLEDMINPIDARINEFAQKVGGEDKVNALQKLKTSMLRIFAGAPDLSELTAMGRTAAADEGLVAGSEPWKQFVDEYVGASMTDHADRAMQMHVPLAQAVEQRRALQQLAFQETKALDPHLRVQLLRDVSREWGDLETSALNKASEAEGKAAGDELRDLNKRYQRLKLAEDAAESTQASYATNRNFSMSDYLTGIGPGMTALAAGHPVGAAVALGSTLAHRELRHHGNAYAAILLDRLGTWGGMARAVQDVDEQVGRAVTQAVSGKRIKLGRVFHTSSSEDRYEKERERVTQMAALSSSVVAPHLQAQTRPLTTHAPETGTLVHQHVETVRSFLASKVPAHDPGLSATPQLHKDVTSAEDRIRFLRYVDAAEGGLPHVMKRLAAGRLTPEDVETADRCFPHSLVEAQAKVSAELAGRKKPVDYQAKLQLSLFMQRPLDPTLDGHFTLDVQQLYAASTPQPKPAGAPPRRGSPGRGPAHLQVGKSMQTLTEKAMG
jgi:hypothetical protein